MKRIDDTVLLFPRSLKRLQSAENHMKLKGIPVAPETQDEGTTFIFVLFFQYYHAH